MSPILHKLNLFNSRLFGRSAGWTGVEIGRHEINLAQLCKIDGSIRLAAVWSVQHVDSSLSAVDVSPDASEPFPWIDKQQFSDAGLGESCQQLENLTALFQGTNTAATLTDGLIEYREMELPIADFNESLPMVHSEIALDMECEPDDIVTACWELPKGRSRSSLTSLAAVSIQRKTATSIANQLLSVGFECKTLDAFPCAMARATSFMVQDPSEITLALDLGYEQATLAIVSNGRLLLTRGLRHQGLRNLLQEIADAFDISLADARVLLFQSCAFQEGTSSPGSSNPLHQHIQAFLQSITAEINRTLRFVERSLAVSTPNQAIVMGPGSQIPKIASLIGNRLGLQARLWTIAGTESTAAIKNTASYAVAAGLSALAWEVC